MKLQQKSSGAPFQGSSQAFVFTVAAMGFMKVPIALHLTDHPFLWDFAQGHDRDIELVFVPRG